MPAIPSLQAAKIQITAHSVRHPVSGVRKRDRSGVVVNPKAVLGEIDGLHDKGVSTDKLFIDARCHCIMPWHLELDALSEAEKAKEGTAIGTTKKGIGPTMDKSERSGIRMHDFIDAERFEEVIRETCARKNRVITGVYGGEPLDADAIIEEYRAYADRLRPMVRDTTVMTYEAVKAGKEVLFEGAQGTLLDLDMGTYPYVTSSHPVAGGCCIGSGVGSTAIDKIMGIFKSYTTRVGEARSRPSCSMRPATISAMRRRVRYRYRPSAPYRLVRRCRCTLCCPRKRPD